MSSDQPRVERFLEQAARVLSGTKIHPVAILQEVQAAAEEGARNGTIPNRYRIFVAATERDHLARFERQLQSGVERMLDEIASRRAAAPLDAWRIEFVPSDSLGTGETRVEASFADLSHRVERSPNAVPQQTEVVTRVTGVTLFLGNGSRVRVSHAPFFIGRSAGCDLVLADLSVSRRHAVVRREPDGSLALHDLGSRNGISVGGTRVQSVVLTPGQAFTLGDIEATVETTE